MTVLLMFVLIFGGFVAWFQLNAICGIWINTDTIAKGVCVIALNLLYLSLWYYLIEVFL